MTHLSPVFCAIDTPDAIKAISLASKLKGRVGGLKFGLEYVMANGPQGVIPFRGLDMPIFLDVKLHDIPNTVAGAITSLLPVEPDYITIHTSGGAAMMKAAVDAASRAKGKHPKLLGVTVLTSLDSTDLKQVGQDTDTAAQVERLALLAKESGLDGIVCSPAEVANLRKVLGPDMILMVPGIRPTWAAANDQKRVMTPREAMGAGATYLVIGRPITGAEDPASAADRVTQEIFA
ncbi:MAG: orotidine-5'-phosphate decarboxylase [Alphaproteobacteria bacterium]|nr:orotidine-5'-phosphate decarboxylase [Alphaproteobacteria bacterium]